MPNGQTSRIAELTAALQSVLPMAEKFSAYDTVADLEDGKQLLDAAQHVLEGGTEFHLPGILRRLLDCPDLDFGDLDPATVEAMNDGEMALAVMPEISARPERAFALGHVLAFMNPTYRTGTHMAAVFDLVATRLLYPGAEPDHSPLVLAMKELAAMVRALRAAHDARQMEMPR